MKNISTLLLIVFSVFFVMLSVVGAEENIVGTEENIVGAEENIVGAEENIVGAEENIVGTEENIDGNNNFNQDTPPPFEGRGSGSLQGSGALQGIKGQRGGIKTIDLEEVDAIELDSDKIYKLGVFESDKVTFKNEDGEWEGFDIDIFNSVAEDIGIEYEIVEKESLSEVLEGLEKSELDFGVGLLTINSQRLKDGVRFSYPYGFGGASILVKSDVANYTPNLIGIFFSWYIWKTILIFCLAIFVFGNLYYFLIEKRKKVKWFNNRDLSLFYTPQIFKALWFSFVKGGKEHVSTDSIKNFHPLSKIIIVPIWIIGLIMTSLITGQIVSELTSAKLNYEIDIKTLEGKKIAVTRDSSFIELFEDDLSLGEAYIVENTQEGKDLLIDGTVYGLLADDISIDMIQYELERKWIDTTKIQENISEEYYGIAMSERIVTKDMIVYFKMNLSILEKIESLEIKNFIDDAISNK